MFLGLKEHTISFKVVNLLKKSFGKELQRRAWQCTILTTQIGLSPVGVFNTQPRTLSEWERNKRVDEGRKASWNISAFYKFFPLILWFLARWMCQFSSEKSFSTSRFLPFLSFFDYLSITKQTDGLVGWLSGWRQGLFTQPEALLGLSALRHHDQLLSALLRNVHRKGQLREAKLLRKLSSEPCN